MRVFLAATCSVPPDSRHLLRNSPYVLESFFYSESWQTEYIKNHWKAFLLDSGAFSFMSKPGVKVDFDAYLGKYIDYINAHDIKHFFELDIDSVVGLPKVEKMRDRLERETGKKCIPVFHRSRGKDYWLDMVKAYDYVAIGGFAIKAIKPAEFKYMDWFIKTAKDADCKIHALGFTNQKGLNRYKFYSADSSSWTSSLRFGTVYTFKNGKFTLTNKGRLTDWRSAVDVTLKAWIQFQKYHDEKGIF